MPPVKLLKNKKCFPQADFFMKVKSRGIKYMQITTNLNTESRRKHTVSHAETKPQDMFTCSWLPGSFPSSACCTQSPEHLPGMLPSSPDPASIPTDLCLPGAGVSLILSEFCDVSASPCLPPAQLLLNGRPALECIWWSS